MLRLLETSVTLRPAQPDDLDFVWSVYADGLRPYLSAYRPWDEAGQRQRFPRLYDAAHSAIVLCEGVAAGFVTIVGHDSTILLQQFFLDAAFRGQGLGGHLLNRFCAEWDEMDRPVSLAVLKNNPAQQLYRRFGFAPTWQSDDRFFMLRPPGSQSA
ncbi:GNAT family N-acetyltransferase [Ferrovibrio xuzhouensis]|uniref:GNAT family N-acetyltransferase n=1 Tax=Ferrovibrio xuzhouensis TaxID=1576914 RepID=A0ABV7VAX6_9PROT